MSEDLVTWLRAQLDDDERVAREPAGGAWTYVDNVHYESAHVCECENCGSEEPPIERHWHELKLGERRSLEANPLPPCITRTQLTPPEAEHIARWDPARVLAEVDAKRRILDEVTARLHPGEHDGGWESADAETDGMASRTVRLLALPYAAMPGYREEWRPDGS